MLLKLASSLLLLGLAVTLCGCPKNCGPVDEPRLDLNITSQTPSRITDIYAIGGVPGATLSTRPYNFSSVTPRLFYQFDLPINQQADQTRYVIVRDTRRDTVTINYRRVFTYEDAECGYIINLTSPTGGLSNPATYPDIVQTTMGTVRSLEFIPTQVFRPAFFSQPADAGIRLNLEWP